MTRRRDAVRLAAIWTGVAVYFAMMAWSIARGGDPTGLIGFFAYPIVGAIILTSRPGNGVGRFLLGVGILWAVSIPLASDAWGPAGETLYSAFGWPLWGLLPLIGLIFPTGRIETRFGRIVAAMLVGYVAAATICDLIGVAPTSSGRANPFAVPALDPVVQIVAGAPGITVFVGCILGVLIDLGVRWRRAHGVAALQYRWLFFGLAVTVLTVVAAAGLQLVTAEAAWVQPIAAAVGVITNLIPVSIGIAVTRHGLYRIGRIVSRTVAYTLVTVLAIGIYAVVVTSVTWVLPGAPAIGVAGATLAAAAVFLPLLRRVRRAVERRFDRERYDAEGVVDDFGEALRTEVDPDAATAGLHRAVERALQPVSVGLWTAGGAA